jgi:hypothetical protein
MQNQIALILFLTEGLVVIKPSILLLSILCLKISKTAVNSICLGTFFLVFFVSFDHTVSVSLEGCKSTTSFNLASVFEFFENFVFASFL